jgi:hypothetical protein
MFIYLEGKYNYSVDYIKGSEDRWQKMYKLLKERFPMKCTIINTVLILKPPLFMCKAKVFFFLLSNFLFQLWNSYDARITDQWVLPIGSIGWSLGPQNLGGLRPRCIIFFVTHEKGGFKIKTVLIIVYFIGNLSFNNLYTFCHLSSDPFI